MEVSFITKNEWTAHNAKNLQNRLQNLLQKCRFSPDEIALLIADLTNRYTEKTRHYHDLTHLYNLYQSFDIHASALKNPLLIEAAIWWHDAIYDPKKKDNEQQSAALATSVFQGKTLPFQLSDLSLIIESTAAHQPQKANTDFDYFLDFDLSILAAPTDIYQQYAAAIRQEYACYPDFLYKMGRRKVLKKFLERDRIYFTPIFFEQCETQARSNIQSEL